MFWSTNLRSPVISAEVVRRSLALHSGQAKVDLHVTESFGWQALQPPWLQVERAIHERFESFEKQTAGDLVAALQLRASCPQKNASFTFSRVSGPPTAITRVYRRTLATESPHTTRACRRIPRLDARGDSWPLWNSRPRNAQWSSRDT